MAIHRPFCMANSHTESFFLPYNASQILEPYNYDLPKADSWYAEIVIGMSAMAWSLNTTKSIFNFRVRFFD